MDPGKPFLDSISLEVRYAFGHTYLDRCGQTMVDLERSGAGWIAQEANPNSGTLENPSLDATLSFDVARFALTAPKVKDLRALGRAASEAWRVVRTNLALEEFLRFGCRFHWLLPCGAIDQAESILKRLSLNLDIPAPLTTRYEPTRRSLVVVLRAADGIEYRVGLEGMQRMLGLPVSALMTTEPRFLPKNRKQAQLDLQKRRIEYDANPQYGVHLDVDCVLVAPEKVAPADFLLAQAKIVERDFVPLLDFK